MLPCGELCFRAGRLGSGCPARLPFLLGWRSGMEWGGRGWCAGAPVGHIGEFKPAFHALVAPGGLHLAIGVAGDDGAVTGTQAHMTAVHGQPLFLLLLCGIKGWVLYTAQKMPGTRWSNPNRQLSFLMLNRRVLWLSPGLMGLLGWWRGVSRLAFVVACRVGMACCLLPGVCGGVAFLA